MLLRYKVPCQKAAEVGVGGCCHDYRAVTVQYVWGFWFVFMVPMTVLSCIFETASKKVRLH